MNTFGRRRKSKGLLPALIWSLGVICIVGCSSTFMVSKGGKGYYLGSDASGIQVLLCESGDLKKVLDGANLQQELKDDLFRFTCTEPSKEKIRELYASLSKEQRRELRLSFQRHGYDINTAFC